MPQPAMKIASSLLFSCLLLTTPLAGMGAASAGQPANPQSAQAAAPGVSDPSLVDLLARLKATAERTDSDLQRLRINKWKTDSENKKQAQSIANSISRNLVNAVPELIQAVQAAPGSLLANFRLYRDLIAVYEAFYGLVESAGAFGPSGDYQALGADLTELDRARQQLAQRLDLLAGANDAELARLRSRPAAAPGTKTPASSNKVVVDDTEPVRKKRKPAASQR